MVSHFAELKKCVKMSRHFQTQKALKHDDDLNVKPCQKNALTHESFAT